MTVLAVTFPGKQAMTTLMRASLPRGERTAQRPKMLPAGAAEGERQRRKQKRKWEEKQ